MYCTNIIITCFRTPDTPLRSHYILPPSAYQTPINSTIMDDDKLEADVEMADAADDDSKKKNGKAAPPTPRFEIKKWNAGANDCVVENLPFIFHSSYFSAVALIFLESLTLNHLLTLLRCHPA